MEGFKICDRNKSQKHALPLFIMLPSVCTCNSKVNTERICISTFYVCLRLLQQKHLLLIFPVLLLFLEILNAGFLIPTAAHTASIIMLDFYYILHAANHFTMMTGLEDTGLCLSWITANKCIDREAN